MDIKLKPLRHEYLDAFRKLLGGSEFGGCFCAVWTSHDESWASRCQDKSKPNFFITKKNVEEGRHVGFLVYQNDRLVGWTGSGPKNSFPLLKTKLGSRLSPFTAEIWSVGCLAIAAEFRGKGLSDAIVCAVESEARTQNAKIIEAYPTRPLHEPRVFRGTYNMYQRLGFKEVGVEKDGDYEILLMRNEL